MTDALVIGYGNDLRSDDGAGRWVADRLEARALPGVDVRSVAQLTPELALDLAGRALVVFVDADVGVSEVSVEPVQAAAPAPVMTHHSDPASLMAMVPAVGQPPKRAHVVSIPASNLDLGLAMTPSTLAAAEQVVERVVELVTASV